jgi:hypothetical protein
LRRFALPDARELLFFLRPTPGDLPAYSEGVVFFDLDDTLIDVNRRVRRGAA